MKSSIVRIGNAHYIRLPKALLDQCRLKDSVELEVADGALQIRPVNPPRSGWAAAFSEMSANQDDRLSDGSEKLDSVWNDTEWRW